MNKKNVMAYAFVLMSAAHLAHGSDAGSSAPRPSSPASSPAPVPKTSRLQACKDSVVNFVPAAIASVFVYDVVQRRVGTYVEKGTSVVVDTTKDLGNKLADGRGMPNVVDGADGNGGVLGVLRNWVPYAVYGWVAYKGGRALAKAYELSGKERTVSLTQEDRNEIAAGLSADLTTRLTDDIIDDWATRNNIAQDGEGEQQLLRKADLPLITGDVVDGWFRERKVVDEDRLQTAIDTSRKGLATEEWVQAQGFAQNGDGANALVRESRLDEVLKDFKGDTVRVADLKNQGIRAGLVARDQLFPGVPKQGDKPTWQ